MQAKCKIEQMVFYGFPITLLAQVDHYDFLRNFLKSVLLFEQSLNLHKHSNEKSLLSRVIIQSLVGSLAIELKCTFSQKSAVF